MANKRLVVFAILGLVAYQVARQPAAPVAHPVRAVAAASPTIVPESNKSARIEIRVRYHGPMVRSALPDELGRPFDLFQLGPENGLKDAVVSLALAEDPSRMPRPAESGAPFPTVIIDQHEFQFIPRIVALRAGQAVRFTNHDAANHNVRGASFLAANQFNILTQFAGDYVHHFASEPKGRPVMLGCDIHGWMRGWVFAFDHPWFAVTDREGRGTIVDVPPGPYVLRVRQPDAEVRAERTLRLESGETAQVEFEIWPREK